MTAPTVPSDRDGHVSHYPPGLSGYTHGGCRCPRCTAANTRQRALQRAGLTRGRRRSFEDRVREEMNSR